MKLMDDYPERVVVGFAFWPFVSLLNFTLVRQRASNLAEVPRARTPAAPPLTVSPPLSPAAAGPTAFPPPGAEPGGLPLGRDLVLYGVRVRNRTLHVTVTAHIFSFQRELCI